MTHARHLARVAAKQRQELLAEEAKAKAKAEAAAVHQGVSETLALGDHRGEEFHAPEPDRGGRPRPVRRLTGLEWVARSGGFTEDELRAGDRYGEAYRAVQGEAELASCLADHAGGRGDGPNPSWLLSRAEWRANMADRLRRYRDALKHPRLIAAADLVCGMELTPRQASKNGQQAATLVELLSVALGLLTEREGS